MLGEEGLGPDSPWSGAEWAQRGGGAGEVGGQIHCSHSSPPAAPASNEILRQVEMIGLRQP